MLKEFLRRTREKKVCIPVIGDAMLDEYYSVDVKRLSPEFPIPAMHSNDGLPEITLPGGGANVSIQSKNFNVYSPIVSLVDPIAKSFFNSFNICTDYTISVGSIPRKKRFYHGSFPTYRWDVEKKYYGLEFYEMVRACNALYSVSHKFLMGKSDVIIFADYNKGVFLRDSSGAFVWKDIVKSDKKTIVDPKGNYIEKWKGCTIFKPNAYEARDLSGKEDWKSQCDYFSNNLGCNAVVITQGGNGVFCWDREFGYFTYCPNKIENPESVIGAGDCFVSFLATAIAHGFNIKESVQIACDVCSIYVGRKFSDPLNRLDLSGKLVEPEDLHGLKNLVFTNGCFDLMHAGHIQLLRFAKSKGKFLAVGINSDESIKRIKGAGRPILPEKDRIEMLSAIDLVDYLVVFDEDTPERVIKAINPTVLVKGGDYKPEDVVGKEYVEELYLCPLVESHSTTGIINYIKSQPCL